MKKIMIVLSVFSLVSCTDMGSCRPKTETLVNNSGRDVELFSYIWYSDGNNPRYWRFSKKMSIKNRDKIYKKDNGCPPLFAYLMFTYFVDGDSLVIDYGDRVMSYINSNSKTVNDRNPYRLDTNREGNFLYTLTPDDYGNAVPKK